MANGRVFRLIGLAYGGLTAIVILVAIAVVSAHVGKPAEARSDEVIVSAR